MMHKRERAALVNDYDDCKLDWYTGKGIKMASDTC